MKHTLLLILTFCTLNCFAQAKKMLYITTFTANGIEEKDIKKQTSTASMARIDLKLTLMGGGNYTAGKVLIQSRTGEKYKQVSIMVTDDSKIPIYFKNPAEFVSYMAERGYEVTKKTLNKSGGDYTFKKK